MRYQKFIQAITNFPLASGNTISILAISSYRALAQHFETSSFIFIKIKIDKLFFKPILSNLLDIIFLRVIVQCDISFIKNNIFFSTSNLSLFILPPLFFENQGCFAKKKRIL